MCGGTLPTSTPASRSNRSIPACAGEPLRSPTGGHAPGVYPRVCGGTWSASCSLIWGMGLSPRVRGNRQSRPPQTPVARVYPRVCGGTAGAAVAGLGTRGLSPRVRGNLVPEVEVPPQNRSIPRVCGGTVSIDGITLRTSGLSPRVRGNQAGAYCSRCDAGSIPACAGEPMRPLPTTNCSGEVYPRVCGGTPTQIRRRRRGMGLSPRVRGNLRQIHAARAAEGSIPACAGEPRPIRNKNRPYAVYPRGVRGNPVAVRPGEVVARSIPACAGEPRAYAGSDSEPAVYPRVCGGTWSRPTMPCSPPGLSPRVRGNHQERYDDAARARSIPACAGEPQSCRRISCQTRVYPRVCGGTPGQPLQPLRVHGLSPRVRGEPTPRSLAAQGGPVYPRVCGGTNDSLPIIPNGIGLSPRVRGNPLLPGPHQPEAGSIPACAGEPPVFRCPRVRAGVYPRVCGGTPPHGVAVLAPPGLSPRVRGNPVAAGQHHPDEGSIPACAGEPIPAPAPAPEDLVYPRVCGGTGRISISTCRYSGLSPRVRGNRQRAPIGCAGPGSIPACAGEPPTGAAPFLPLGVYPRVCGGTIRPAPRLDSRRGLSPRVRGNLSTSTAVPTW